MDTNYNGECSRDDFYYNQGGYYNRSYYDGDSYREIIEQDDNAKLDMKVEEKSPYKLSLEHEGEYISRRKRYCNWKEEEEYECEKKHHTKGKEDQEEEGNYKYYGECKEEDVCNDKQHCECKEEYKQECDDKENCESKDECNVEHNCQCKCKWEKGKRGKRGKRGKKGKKGKMGKRGHRGKTGPNAGKSNLSVYCANQSVANCGVSVVFNQSTINGKYIEFINGNDYITLRAGATYFVRYTFTAYPMNSCNTISAELKLNDDILSGSSATTIGSKFTRGALSISSGAIVTTDKSLECNKLTLVSKKNASVIGGNFTSIQVIRLY